jgi:undecaprenyl diphosphate synthase
MDGNRRWAKQHGLEILRGHEYVANKVIEPLVERCIERGVKYVTLWAFSTENWKRDRSEVIGLMELFRQAFQKQSQRLHKMGVRLRHIGDLQKFPPDIQQGIAKWEADTAQNQRITVTFALNYGGRDEVLRATNKLLAVGQTAVTEAEFAAALDTAGMPDPDFIIRTGGEQRLSGFLPWQAVYAELYFPSILMPDFTSIELDKALDEFAQRQRRFGG